MRHSRNSTAARTRFGFSVIEILFIGVGKKVDPPMHCLMAILIEILLNASGLVCDQRFGLRDFFVPTSKRVRLRICHDVFGTLRNLSDDRIPSNHGNQEYGDSQICHQVRDRGHGSLPLCIRQPTFIESDAFFYYVYDVGSF